MPIVRVVLEGADAPVAQSDSWMTLYRRAPVAKPRWKRNYWRVRRQEDEDEEDEEDEDEEESDSSEDTDGSDSSGEDGESSSSSSSDSDAEEEQLTPAQQRLQQASPFSDFELPSVPNLGALPMPPLNTRRSMRLDKIKRRPRGSLSRRQLPGPPPDELSSESTESDGISSESEDEDFTSSGNAPPSPPATLPLPPPPSADLDPPPPLPPPAVVPEQSSRSTSRSSSSISSSSSQSSTSTSTPRQLAPPATRTSTDNDSSASSAANTITSFPASSPTSIDLGQSTFIAAADATGTPSSTLPMGPDATASSQQSPGPAPESQTAMIAGVTVLGVAVVITMIFLLFRFCVPVRTWYATRRQKHRDDKATRLGTAPSPWKWPLQFIFGSDRPAPPRRQQQHLSEFYYHEKVNSYASNRDLENQTSPGLVADGFRPPQATSNSPPQYKSFTTASNANSYVANGWRAPLSHISQRLSNWPRRSGTARWFFGGGASRWSDSEASEANARTTYSEGQLVDMYGAPTPRSVVPPSGGGVRRSSISKSPLQVQVSQTEITTPSPPLPIYRNNTNAATATIPNSPQIITTTIIKPPPPTATVTNSSSGLGLTQTPIRPRASPRATPRNSYLRSSVATTATSGTGVLAMEPPPLPFAAFRPQQQQVSHFSASTVDPATPRRFVGEGLPKGPRVGGGRFPVRPGSGSSVGSDDGGREKPLPVPRG